jgi:hypothetical protein
MIPANTLKLACAAAFAAGLFATSAAVAQPDGVTPLSVTPAHPTTVTVSIRGKDDHQVRKDVSAAALFVCRNFVGVKGISLDDVDWCADRSASKAMKQYAAIKQGRFVADAGAIVLAAR